MTYTRTSRRWPPPQPSPVGTGEGEERTPACGGAPLFFPPGLAGGLSGGHAIHSRGFSPTPVGPASRGFGNPLRASAREIGHSFRAIWAGLTIVLLLLVFIAPLETLAQDKEPIRVLATDTRNNYPDGLIFTLQAEADHPLARIEVYYRTQGGGSTTRQPVEIEPGQEVLASATWDTSRITVAPSTPVIAYWKLEDEEGNRLTTPEQTVYYDDLRYEWREYPRSQADRALV